MGPCARPTDGKLRAHKIHICSPRRIQDQKDDLSTHSLYIFLSNNHRGSNPPTCPTPKQKKTALQRYSFFFICCSFGYFYITPHCPDLFLMLQHGDNIEIRNRNSGTSLVIQWLRLCISNAGGVGLILSQGTKIPHAELCSQKKSKQASKNRQIFSVIRRKKSKVLWIFLNHEPKVNRQKIGNWVFRYFFLTSASELCT